MSVERSARPPQVAQRAISSGERLVTPTSTHDLTRTHAKARIEKGQGYPDRFPVAEGATWKTIDRVTYMPPEYTAATVLASDRSQDPTNPRLWADPVDPRQAKGAPEFASYEGRIVIDDDGRPLNPQGPTGISGRGLLGNWGVNNAADPIVTRISESGHMEMIVIQRKDTGEWAIPGGMVDRGERVTTTLKRELGEETSATLDFDEAIPVYQGYVDDPRNTDNAWIETDAFHLHLDTDVQIALDAKDDAADARWMELTAESVRLVYANHGDLVFHTIASWVKRTGQVVATNGLVGKAA